MPYLLILCIVVGIAAAIYVGLSWANPHIVQVIFGSVALGLFIGITSTIVFVFFQERIERNLGKSIILSDCPPCFAMRFM